MNTDDETYLLRVSGKQAEQMHRALEFFARIGAGQLDELLQHPAVSLRAIRRMPSDRGHYLIAALKDELFNLPPAASFSVMSAPEPVRITWDIGNVIRHRLAWDRADNPESRDWSMMAVAFDGPAQTADESLPTIERVPTSGPAPEHQRDGGHEHPDR